MNAQERLNALLETEWVPNQTSWTLNQIVLHTQSTDLAGKIEVSLTAMSQLGVPFSQSSLIALSTAGGLPLWQSHAQDLIDYLAVQSQALPEPLRWDAQFVTTVKSLGGVNRPRWQSQGYEVEPTLESIQSEIEQAALREFADTLIQRVTGAINLATAADGASEASIKAAAVAEAGV